MTDTEKLLQIVTYLTAWVSADAVHHGPPPPPMLALIAEMQASEAKTTAKKVKALADIPSFLSKIAEIK